MKNSTFLLLFLMLQFLSAQKKEVSQEVLESIKKDVWTPFMESYAQLDADKLKSIHDADIFRVTIDQNSIQTGQTYLDDFGGFLDQVNTNGGGLGIAFAIVTIAINSTGDLVYQTGYYEFSSKNKDDPNLVVRGYGQFSVGIRKTEGGWKLFIDADKRVDLSLEEFENQDIVYRLGN